MSILGGLKIIEAVDRGDIHIDPFDAKMVNPVSVDLTLGDKCALYCHSDSKNWAPDALDSRKKIRLPRSSSIESNSNPASDT